MIRNVGKIDQYVRIVAGLAMIAFVFKEGTLGSTWPFLLPIGAILLATAFFSLCPLYSLLGWNTVRKTTRAS
jgi:predicted lysophospholipase L1 biosynthesis ABC-type transport system permease subunit